MLDHQSGKSKGPKPLPHKPQQQNHPFYTPFTAGEHEQCQGDKIKGASSGETAELSWEAMNTTWKRGSVQSPSRAKGKPELTNEIEPMQNMW